MLRKLSSGVGAMFRRKQDESELNEELRAYVEAAAEEKTAAGMPREEAQRVAKAELGFDFLLDISSVDNYGADPRWTIVYHLYGLGHRCHLRLKTDVSEEQSELPTVTGVWRTADWHEREIFDMMGITFSGHPDLRRILNPEDWNGNPLRRDYPLGYETVMFSFNVEEIMKHKPRGVDVDRE